LSIPFAGEDARIAQRATQADLRARIAATERREVEMARRIARLEKDAVDVAQAAGRKIAELQHEVALLTEHVTALHDVIRERDDA
jgi:hypothetical protein